ncbi:MAG TPA: cupin domain-containing protein [Crinalium sp.]|jgi:quercetin dioxygenase-like cupin family protein
MTTTDLNGIVLQINQGNSYWVLGDLYTFKAIGEETSGQYALLELVIQPQDGTPLHVHSHEAEAFYVQDGEIEFQLGDRTIIANAGTFLHSPPGQPHRFVNKGTTPAQMLCWATPAGVEKFFAAIGTKVNDPTAPPPQVTSADIEKVMAIAPQYGITILPEQVG